jgi:ribosomal RNA assembly protein
VEPYKIFLTDLMKTQGFVFSQGLQDFLRKQGIDVIVQAGDELLVQGPSDKVIKIRELLNLLSYGVSLERAQKYFLNDEYYICIDLNDTLKSKDMARTIGRIIGSGGSFKKKIEEITSADIIVHNNNIIIIGSYFSIDQARLAVEEIILGKPQSVVIKNLQRRIASRLGGR